MEYVSNIIKAYTSYLSPGYSQPDEKEIPWDALSAKADEFYDTTTFTFSTPLRHPSNLCSSEVYLLCEDLSRLSTNKRDNPFVFYSRTGGDQECEGTYRFTC